MGLTSLVVLLTDDLGHGPLWVLSDSFEVVDDPPIVEPSPQFPRFEKKIAIVRPSEPGLVHGVGLVNEDSSYPERPPYGGDEGPVKVIEDDDPSISVLRKG